MWNSLCRRHVITRLRYQSVTLGLEPKPSPREQMFSGLTGGARAAMFGSLLLFPSNSQCPDRIHPEVKTGHAHVKPVGVLIATSFSPPHYRGGNFPPHLSVEANTLPVPDLLPLTNAYLDLLLPASVDFPPASRLFQRRDKPVSQPLDSLLTPMAGPVRINIWLSHPSFNCLHSLCLRLIPRLFFACV